MANIAVHIAEAAACALFAVSVATDLRRREVPNAVPLLLLGLFALYAAAGAVRPVADLWQHLAIGAAVLASGFGLYLTGRFGAGDVKLLAVAGVWIGPAFFHLTLFMFGMAAFALALVMAALLPFERLRRMRRELPFAVAIAPPAVIVLALRALSDGI
ncbi:MAG: prepilin peptidase [Rhodospirillales bacterium]|nr:prepilin peptidase [Rhodospirillales bacterium]